MPEVKALFWDVGGVVLSNGWDYTARAEAAQRFQLDWEDFEDRHENAFVGLELGRMTLDAYLNRTVFYRARPFSKEEFTAFLFGRSRENGETRAILDELTSTRHYLLAALNNEGLELNQYRIREFHLARNFQAFFSSCYLGMRKPDEGIYRMAMDIAHCTPEECIFLDDRPLNVETARRLGMRTIHFQNPAQLRAELAQHGVRGMAVSA
jgi:putative hydrolase of the HAD superfamily